MRCSFICHSDVWRLAGLSLQTFTSLCSRYLLIILSFGCLTAAFISYYVLLMDLLFNKKWHELHDWFLEVYDWRIIHYEGNLTSVSHQQVEIKRSWSSWRSRRLAYCILHTTYSRFMTLHLMRFVLFCLNRLI